MQVRLYLLILTCLLTKHLIYIHYKLEVYIYTFEIHRIAYNFEIEFYVVMRLCNTLKCSHVHCVLMGIYLLVFQHRLNISTLHVASMYRLIHRIAYYSLFRNLNEYINVTNC